MIVLLFLGFRGRLSCSGGKIILAPDFDKSIAADLPSIWAVNHIMASNIKSSIIWEALFILSGEWGLYALPYANYSRHGVNSGKADTATFGVISGVARNLQEYGVLSGFIGYENSDTDMPQSNELESNARYIGRSYYNEFVPSKTIRPYIKTTASYTNANPNIYTKSNSADTYLNIISAGVAAGVNVTVGNSVFTPEFGFDYDYFKIGRYTLGSEKYSRSTLKLPSLSTTIGWQQEYNNNLYTTLKGGLKHLLEDSHKTALRDGGNYLGKVESNMPNRFGMVQAGVGYRFGWNLNLNLNYQGGFANDIQNHTAMAEVEYRF